MNIPKPEDPRGMEIKREGSDHALPVVYGERMVGGIVVHDWVTDSIEGIAGIEQHERKNAYLHQIIAFCHGPVHSIDALYFNGEHENAQQYQGKYATYRMNGSDTQNAIPAAVNNIGNWNANMRGRNVAYIYLVLYQDENQTIWRGEPEVQAVIRGRTLYDPRTDQTGYSDNPALAALDYLINPIYGRGLNANRIDMAAFASAANFCDEATVSTSTRTICEPRFSTQEAPVCRTEQIEINTPRYRIDAIINTEATVFNNYRELLQVFRAYPRRPNGMVSLHVETVAPESFPVFDDFELVGSIKYQLGGQRNRYNRFKIRFPNKLNRYERDEFTYPPKDDPLYQQWLDEDNGKELLGELELNTISETSCAAQNAEIAAKASRLSGVMATTLPTRARLLEPGDIIGINSDLYGWTAKQFRIQSIGETTTGAFEVELREHEDAVYTWSGASWDEQVGGSWLGNPAQPDAPTNLQIFPDPTLATGGRLTWQSVNDAFVREYEVVISQDGDAVFDNRTRGTAFDLPLLDAGEYTVQVFSITTLGYRSAPATLSFELSEPVAPTDLRLTIGNWEVTSRPLLAGAGLGTQFNFYVTDDFSEQPPFEPMGTGYNFTATGLMPNTAYRIWVQTINPLGVSDWIYDDFTTLEDPGQVADLIEDLLADSPIFEDVIDELRDRVEGVRDRITTTRESFIDNINDILDNAFETRDRVIAVNRETQERKTGISQVNERVDTESEQRILQGEIITATLDNEVATRQAQVINLTDVIANETQSRVTQFNQITADFNDEVATRQAQITTVQEAIADEAGVRATNVNQLNARVDTVDSEVEAVSTFAQNVDARVDGAVQATNLLEARVQDNETGLSATSTLLQDAGLQADGSTNATTAILNQINDPETGLQANADLILDVIQDPFGNSSALADLNTDVNNLEGDIAQANLTLESVYDAENDELIARGALVAEANGQIAGVVLQSGQGPSTIEFKSDVVRFLNQDGEVSVGFDNDFGQYFFDGSLFARSLDLFDGGYINIGQSSSSDARTVIKNGSDNTLGNAQVVTVKGFGNLWIATAMGGEVYTSINGGSSFDKTLLQGDTQYGVAVNGSTYVTLGVNGIGWRTTNAGGNWDQFNVGSVSAILDMENVGANFVAVGTSGSVYRSTNSGASWGLISTPTTSGLRGIASNGSSTYIIVGDNGVIIRSTNSGAGWSAISSGVSSRLWAVGGSNTTFLAVGDNGTILRSTNTGGSWSNISANIPTNESIRGVAESNGIFVVATSSGAVYRSTNNGNSWIQLDTPVASSWFTANASGSTIIIAGDNGSALRFTSSGASLSDITSDYYALWIGFGDANNQGRSFSVTNNGKVFMRDAEIEDGDINIINGSRRIRISATGDYAIWIGPSNIEPNDLEADYWVKNNGDGFIRGDFFKGKLIESRYGSGSGTTLPVVATASGHVSAGNTVEISGAVSLNGTGPGSLVGQQRTVTITARRGSTVVGTRSVTMVGQLEEGVNVAVFSANASFDIVDTGNSAQTYDYSVTASGNLGFTISTNINFKTFENKVS